jgi:hypothetical protein
MRSRSAMYNNGQAAEVLARQGMRLPQIVLKRLRDAGIYCQPTISIEHQNLAKRYVLRAVESGGAIVDLGAYSSFVGVHGETLAWLQRVDSIGVNGVHAIALAPALVRLEMLRIERTYDLLITRHSLASSAGSPRPRLDSSILFYGRRGSLEMELWGRDAVFCGTVCPVFYNRAGERANLPTIFQDAVTRITTAVCCLGCRHSHVLKPNAVVTTSRDADLDEANGGEAMVSVAETGAM